MTAQRGLFAATLKESACSHIDGQREESNAWKQPLLPSHRVSHPHPNEGADHFNLALQLTSNRQAVRRTCSSCCCYIDEGFLCVEGMAAPGHDSSEDADVHRACMRGRERAVGTQDDFCRSMPCMQFFLRLYVRVEGGGGGGGGNRGRNTSGRYGVTVSSIAWLGEWQ